MPQFQPSFRTVRAYRHKQEQREQRRHAKAVARGRQRVRRALTWIKRQTLLTPAEREWRIRILTGPDTRSLTGRLMGDPHFLRSALYFHTLKERA